MASESQCFSKCKTNKRNSVEINILNSWKAWNRAMERHDERLRCSVLFFVPVIDVR